MTKASSRVTRLVFRFKTRPVNKQAQMMDQARNRVGSFSIQWMAWGAIALNGFAFLTVNYWIYTARWTYIDRNLSPGDGPPTISRAISDPFVGEPFAIWITLSGICLVFGVFLLVATFWRQLASLSSAGPILHIAKWVLLPGILALQISSAIGMHWLSIYRFPDAHEAHMVGSYTFFGSQALVVLLFTLFNLALLRNQGTLAQLENNGHLAIKWVRRRFWFGLFCLFYTGVYGWLFMAKSSATFGDNATIYVAYVSAEPTLISSFLLLLLLCHFDLFRRKTI